MSSATGGCFIVLEGGEGVGKTTQWRRLADRLAAAGHEVVALREPGGTPAGDALRAVLLDPQSALTPETEALLFAASRAQLVRDVITPALQRGAVVLVDRFLLSTFAYQGRGRALSLAALRDVRMGDPESAERLLTHEVGECSDDEENDEHLQEHPG